MNQISRINNRCPYLGLSDDKDTWLTIPGNENCCHRAQLSYAVKIDHQTTTCLSNIYYQCPVYISGAFDRKVLSPNSLYRPKRTITSLSKLSWKWSLIALTMLSILIVGLSKAGTTFLS